MTIYRTALAVTFLLLAHSGLAAQIHVSPFGNDTTGTGSLGNPFKTISKGASVAVSGTTIILAPGTYGDDEQIVLGNKNLTIAGAGRGVSIVKPHPTLLNTLPSGFVPGTPASYRVAIVVDGTSRVDLRDLTIDGDFRMPASQRLVGVFFRDGADGSLENVEIKNTRANPITSSQFPAAAIVRGDRVADPCDVTFRNCWVHDFGKVGIATFFTAAGEVEYCTVQGAGSLGANSPAQICVQIGFNATALVRHNTVADAVHASGTTAAVGILAYDAGPVAVEGNSVARCDDCVAISRQALGTVTTFIRRNRCTASTGRGVRVESAMGVIVRDNMIHAARSVTGSPAWDDTATGNAWANNNYSDWPGAGTYTIPGSTAYVDSTPRRDSDDFSNGIPIQVPVFGFSRDLLVADLDGQNLADIATVNELPGQRPSLSIRLSNGLGGYSVANLSFGAALVARPVSIAAGEFNGSPGTDLVVLTTNISPATIHDRFYIFGNDGAGGFTVTHIALMPTGADRPTDVAAGDIDADGLDDFTVAYLGEVSNAGGGTVFHNDGGGGSNWSSTALVGPTLRCRGVAMASLDVGTSVDVVLTEGSLSSGMVRAYSNDGAGNFSEFAVSPVSVDANPTAVAVGDLDADGDADILVTSLGSGGAGASVAILTNQLPTALPVQPVPTDNGPFAIAIGNIGDDTDPDTLRTDAMVMNQTSANFTQLGEFGLAGPNQGGLVLALNQAGVPTTPSTVTLAEMTGDGLIDLVYADAVSTRVFIRRGIPRPRQDIYGAGCPGTGGRVPFISVGGGPAVAAVPNGTFGLRIANAVTTSPAILFISTGPWPFLLPCQPMFDLSSFASVNATTNAIGTAFIPLPIPPLPQFLGVKLYNQWIVFDVQAALLGNLPFSATQGLVFRLGV